MRLGYITVYLLIFAALFLWIYSILEAGEIPEGLKGFGLVSVLPAGFVISLSFLSASFFAFVRMRNARWHVLFFQVILLILFIHLTPVLVEHTARFTSTYANYQSVDYISQKGHINALAQWIHNWPSFSIIMSIVTEVAAIPAEPLLSIYPVLFNVVLFFPFFVFFRLVFDDSKQTWIAVWVFYIANWVGQDYFSMQSLGFLALVLFSLLLLKFGEFHEHVRTWFILELLLFFLITTTHLLSSIAALSLLLVFFVFKQFRKLSFVVLLISIFAFWTAYVTGAYLEWHAKEIISVALNLEFKVRTNVAGRVAGSAERVIAAQIRLAFSGLLILFGLVGISLLYRHGKMGKREHGIFLIFVSLFPLLLFSSYGGELFTRIFLFSLVPLCYFIVRGTSWKVFYSMSLMFLVFFAPFLHMISRYGNESLDYVPPGELKGAEFMGQMTTYGYTIGHYRDVNYHDNHLYASFSETEWRNNRLLINDIQEKYLNWPRFVVISYSVVETYTFFRGETQFIANLNENLTSSVYYNKVYSNPDFDVYLEHASG